MENITRQFICDKFHPFDLVLIPAPEHGNFCRILQNALDLQNLVPAEKKVS